MIAKHQERVQEKTTIDAAWVLNQSVRLYKMATGETPSVQEKLVKQAGENVNTIYAKERNELCSTDLSMAIRALDLIGRNRAVQAFQDSVEIEHVHYLEEILNRRGKAVEEAAEARRLRLVKDNP